MGNTDSSGIEFELGKFAEFDENNKIIFNNILTKFNNVESKCVILSMLGCARVGKSTFINGFLSYLFRKNIDIAKCSNGADHCTRGIDYISFVYNFDTNISIQMIILDCQGLLYEDSKNDDKLLSVIYSLSDVIVYHDTGIINNQTLNALTSLCLVADHIKSSDDEKDQKPMLFFRMRDYNLDCDPNLIVQKTFAIHNDQYDKVRGAIHKLFPTIDTITTAPLGKKEQTELKNKNYMSILNTSDTVPVSDEYGFNDAYHKILSCAQTIKIKTVGSVCKHADKVICQINNNQKISFNDYDYYTFLIKQRFDNYWNNEIDKVVYLPIKPTEYECSRLACIDRLNLMNSQIEKFKKVFSEVEQTMIEEEIIKFKLKIEPAVLKTLEECDDVAMRIIDIRVEKFLKDEMVSVFSPIKIYGPRFDLTNEKKICGQKIEKFCNSMYKDLLSESVVKKTREFLESQFQNVFDSLNKFVENEEKIFNDICKNTIEVLDQLTSLDYLENQINNITNFTLTCEQNLAEIYLMTKNTIYCKFSNKIKLHRITGFTYDPNIRAKYKSIYSSKNEDDVLFEQLIKLMNDRLDNIFFQQKSVLPNMYEKHAKYMLEKCDSIGPKVIKANPMFQFTCLIFNTSEKIKNIIKKILFDNNICSNINTTNYSNSVEQRYYTLDETRNILHYCHLIDRDEKILQFLCKYVDLKYDFVVDNIFTNYYKSINSKLKNTIPIVHTIIIDQTTLFGKIFIDKIVKKYVDNTYKIQNITL